MIDHPLNKQEFEQIFADLVSSKQRYEGVQCWSLRKLCSIFHALYPDIQCKFEGFYNNLRHVGNRAGYSLDRNEFNALVDKKGSNFAVECTLNAFVDNYNTEIEDWLINAYMLYWIIPDFISAKSDQQRLKDFVVLETAQIFKDNQ